MSDKVVKLVKIEGFIESKDHTSIINSDEFVTKFEDFISSFGWKVLISFARGYRDTDTKIVHPNYTVIRFTSKVDLKGWFALNAMDTIIRRFLTIDNMFWGTVVEENHPPKVNAEEKFTSDDVFWKSHPREL